LTDTRYVRGREEVEFSNAEFSNALISKVYKHRYGQVLDASGGAMEGRYMHYAYHSASTHTVCVRAIAATCDKLKGKPCRPGGVFNRTSGGASFFTATSSTGSCIFVVFRFGGADCVYLPCVEAVLKRGHVTGALVLFVAVCVFTYRRIFAGFSAGGWNCIFRPFPVVGVGIWGSTEVVFYP
jgi:hypothetical protein